MFDLAQRDLEFHLLVAELSGNSRLVSVLKQQRLIEFTFALSQDPAASGRSHKLMPSHLEIADAIASGDAAGSEKLIRRHILRNKEARAGVTGETA
jgi:DNA-binding FadR family transcriptional regulator